MASPIYLLSTAEVRKLRGNRSKSAHYKDIQEGLFVPPVAISDRSRGTPQYEVDAIQKAVVAGQPKAAIRALVRDLIAARKTAGQGGAK